MSRLSYITARVISVTFAIVLSTLLLISICSAQQTSTPPSPNGAVIGGDGTANYIPIWRTPNYLLSSVIYQASSGNIGIGTTAPATKLDVNGGINTAATYQIGGSNVVSIGSPGTGNLFLGRGGFNTTGISNTFAGDQAGLNTTTGSRNTFLGAVAGSSTISDDNTFVGFEAGLSNTTGSQNIFIGTTAGIANQTGIYDVYIANEGYGGGGTESHTIRIGNSDYQSATYIAAIYGATVTGTAKLVCIDANGHLGTTCTLAAQNRINTEQEQVIAQQQQRIELLQKQNAEFQQRLSRLEALIAQK